MAPAQRAAQQPRDGGNSEAREGGRRGGVRTKIFLVVARRKQTCGCSVLGDVAGH